MTLQELITEWHEHLVTYLPNNAMGVRCRYAYYKNKLSSCKGAFTSKTGFRIYGAPYVSVGERCHFSDGVIICASNDGKIEIGNDVTFGFRSAVVSGNHRFDDINIPINQQGSINKPVIISDDVWIGSDAKILSGVTIGKHSVIGANSVVTKDVPSYCVVAGIPAKVIKRLLYFPRTHTNLHL